MPLDGFLELQRGGSPVVHGETRDHVFSQKKAMAITSFEFGSEGGGGAASSADDEHGDKKKKTTAHTPPGPTRTANGPSTTAAPPKPPVDPMTTLYFKVTKDVDLATPDLFLAYCKNHRGDDDSCFDLARVTLRRAGGREPQEYLIVEFYKVFVTSFNIQGGSKDELPEETVEFSFKEMIRVTYEPQVPHGTARPNRKEFQLDPQKRKKS